MAFEYIRRHITCDGKQFANVSRAHEERRICPVTGWEYWTVDQDPNPDCGNHTEAERTRGEYSYAEELEQ